MTAATETKKTAAATDAVKISDAVQTLAKIIGGHMTIDKEGVVTVPADIYESTLPEDLTLAQVKKVQKHRSEVVAATTLALSEKALPAMKKNTGLEKVSTAFKIGQDKLELAVHRQREFNDGSGGKIVKHGAVSIGYTASGATNAGDFAKVRKHISNEASLLFG